MTRWARRASVGVLALTLGGCARTDSASGAGVQGQLEVLARLSGCEQVHENRRCVPPAHGDLRWWVQAPAGTVASVVVAGEPVALRAQAVGDAQRYHFRVPASAASLTLRVTDGQRDWSRSWHVMERRACPAAEAMKAARKAPNLNGVEALAASVEPSDPCHAEVLGELARAHLAAGLGAQAQRELRSAMDAQRRAGCRSCEARDGFALAFALTMEARQFDEARQVLDRLELRQAGNADTLAQAYHYRGILAFEAGDLRAALSLLREADARAQALGLEEQRHAVALSMALSLQRLGRPKEAVEQLRALRAQLTPGASSCAKAVLENNLAWAALAEAEGEVQDTRGEAYGRVVEGFETALRAYREGCNRASQIRNVLVNLAYARQRAGDASGAQESLRLAKEAGADGDPRTAPWLAVIAAHLAFDGKRYGEARKLFVQGQARALDALQDAAAWQAQLGEARALEATGEPQGAIDAYRRAEAILDEQVRWTPLVEGLDTFLASRDRGARALVDLLLRVGRPEEALRVVRAARIRALWSLRWLQAVEALAPAHRRAWDDAIAAYHRERSSLEQEVANDWQLSDASLQRVRAARLHKRRALHDRLERALSLLPPGAKEPSLPPERVADGELLWTAFPATTGWVLFGQDEQGVAWARIPEVPSDAASQALADTLLGPFDDKIASARRVRVLAYGPLRDIDVHALPWRGAPLVGGKTVVYAADLRAPAESAHPERDQTLLLVADPRRDLPSARLEADAVTRALAPQMAQRHRRLEGADATRAAVLDALPAAGWLHFAGHGEFAGDGGWDSGLPLADGGRLTVGDILALPQAPQMIVLSGCETGRTSDRAPLSQIGLAQAFTIAGSRVAVAATRPVSDELASRLSVALYAALRDARDPVDALSVAQRSLAQTYPESDWSAFRAFLP